MLNSYQYDIIEGWKRLNRDPLIEQAEHQSREHYIEANGYYSSGDCFGTDVGWAVKMYAVNNDASVKPEFPYLVDISSPSQGQLIFCADFMSALDIVRQFAVIGVAELMSFTFDALEYRLDDEWQRSDRWRDAKWRKSKASRLII